MHEIRNSQTIFSPSNTTNKFIINVSESQEISRVIRHSQKNVDKNKGNQNVKTSFQEEIIQDYVAKKHSKNKNQNENIYSEITSLNKNIKNILSIGLKRRNNYNPYFISPLSPQGKDSEKKLTTKTFINSDSITNKLYYRELDRRMLSQTNNNLQNPLTNTITKPKNKITKNQFNKFYERQHIKNQLVKQKVDILHQMQKEKQKQEEVKYITQRKSVAKHTKNDNSLFLKRQSDFVALKKGKIKECQRQKDLKELQDDNKSPNNIEFYQNLSIDGAIINKKSRSSIYTPLSPQYSKKSSKPFTENISNKGRTLSTDTYEKMNIELTNIKSSRLTDLTNSKIDQRKMVLINEPINSIDFEAIQSQNSKQRKMLLLDEEFYSTHEEEVYHLLPKVVSSRIKNVENLNKKCGKITDLKHQLKSGSRINNQKENSSNDIINEEKNNSIIASPSSYVIKAYETLNQVKK